ncbi:MerR family transcriptional regulator [Peptostreptococcus sp. MV1]|uniref:MerR family transcriptional regulator n=1 Tax=Peptostreptococcus sp. MV1 TaxID=1219626 RepID=UPI00068F803F|nr:MerR family transcriptional regulator [Peptostreptococcus sp. MV1]
MLRSEIQEKTGLTRKAIEYYENKDLVKPQKTINVFRNYSQEDLASLKKISVYRKLGLSVYEIKKILQDNENILPSILRKKQYYSDLENRKNEILKLLSLGENIDTINQMLTNLEKEETIYTLLENYAWKNQ